MKINEKINDMIRSKQTQLPTLPVIADNVLSMARDEATSSKDLAEVVSQDQAIANKIIKLANSAYYGMMKTIDSIPRAITIIGFNEVISLTIGMSVISTFKGKKIDEILNMQDLWVHSIGCAFAAKNIAKKINSGMAEQIFLNGLLHDMGKVIFAVYFPQEYREVLEEAETSQTALHRKEGQVLGIDHADLSGLLMTRWHFPDNLLLPSRFHHDPERCPPNYRQHTLIVELADFLCRKANLGYSGNPVVPKSTKAKEKLGFDNRDIAEDIEELKKQRSKIEAFFQMIK